MNGNNGHLNRQEDVSDAEIVSNSRRAEADDASEHDVVAGEAERLDPLFTANLADDYRSRWRSVQSSFVDDPRKAVAQGDQLVTQVLKTLSDSFEGERDRLEKELSRTGEASTETLRVALRRYRSLFERLLSV